MRYVFEAIQSIVDLEMLLVPEHGFFCERAYMESVPDGIDPRFGLPVVSLYGNSRESLAPKPELINGLDAVVFDIQDVGSRYYTFLATMAMCMEVCAAQGIRFVVLDRPNPIGNITEGNTVKESFRSFVGYVRGLQNRHGMTPGQVARLHLHSERLDLELIVVKCKGDKGLWPGTGLSWIPPSPNMPTWETALVYPGMCLLEGTNLSEGRGTTTPFFVFGAPYIKDPWKLVSAISAMNLPGVMFRPTFFVPAFDKWAGHRCGGAQLIVRDPTIFKPLYTGLAILYMCLNSYPGCFEWRRDAYEFVTDRLAIDLLLGDDEVRHALEAGDFEEAVAVSKALQTHVYEDEWNEKGDL